MATHHVNEQLKFILIAQTVDIGVATLMVDKADADIIRPYLQSSSGVHVEV